MNSEKFFLYLHRFNTLIPAGGLFLILCLIGWALISNQSISQGKPIIPPAGVAVTSEDVLRFHLAHFDGGADNLVLLVNADGEKNGYEGRASETRNLLFVSTEKEKAQWLFPSQDQILSKILPMDRTNDRNSVIYLEIKPKAASDVAAKDSKVALSLVRSDGSGLTNLVSEADEIMENRVRGDNLQVVYQKDAAIRSMRIALSDFKIKSDRLVVSLDTVKSKAR